MPVVMMAGVLLPLALTTLAAADDPCRDGRLTPAFRRRVQALMDAGAVPGLAIAIVGGGRTRCAGGLGTADGSAPVEVDTVFEAASLSKPVFAYAALQLVAAGRLDLDRPLAEYVPLPEAASDPRFSRITARAVLTHTSGLTNSVGPQEPRRLLFAPGERFSYSGDGFNLLQAVVEKVAREPLEALAAARVFGPLRMRSTSYVWREAYRSREASGHDAVGRAIECRRPGRARAASSLHTTVSDYARFMEAMLRGRGLERSLWRSMLEGSVAVDPGCVVCPEDSGAGRSAVLRWGLGWGVERGAASSFFHWGDNGGFHTLAMGSTQTGDAAVLLANGANGHAIFPPIVGQVLPGAHPAFEWMGYEPYDAPWRAVLAAIR